MTTAPDDDLDRAAWAWVDHLRHGGSTPWLTWLAGDHPADPRADSAADSPTGPAGPPAGRLPGAAQLELVRRLAERRRAIGPGGPTTAGFTGLADLALHRSGPGRGLAELPLLWPGRAGGSPGTVGAPPVDPARVPSGELLRIGLGTLADLLLAEPVPPEPRTSRRGPRRRPWDRRFHLAGAPTMVARVRADLAAGGHVEGGRRPEVLLFAAPFPDLLGQVWSARVQHGGRVAWSAFVSRWVRRDRLPPSAALADLAAHWAARVGPARVHVLVSGPEGDHPARRTAATVLRLPAAGDRTGGTADLARLSAAGVEVVRLMNRLLGVRVGPERHRPVTRRLVALLDDDGPGPGVPPEARDWATARAEELVRALRAGGYAVHGDLDLIASVHPAGTGRPDRRAALDLVLDACLRAHGDAEAGRSGQR